MSDSGPACPLCGNALVAARTVNVCHACHATVIDGSLRVSSTGEFRVEQIMEAAALGDAEPQAATVAPGDRSVRCTFCGKSEGDVRKLLSHGPAHICNECVALCADVLRAELGDDWA